MFIFAKNLVENVSIFPFSLRMCNIMCNFAQYNRTKRRLLTSYDQAYE